MFRFMKNIFRKFGLTNLLLILLLFLVFIGFFGSKVTRGASDLWNLIHNQKNVTLGEVRFECKTKSIQKWSKESDQYKNCVKNKQANTMANPYNTLPPFWTCDSAVEEVVKNEIVSREKYVTVFKFLGFTYWVKYPPVVNPGSGYPYTSKYYDCVPKNN